MAEAAEGWWWSRDGVRLNYRDYRPPAETRALPPILCLPGLTRNGRDFAEVARRLSDRWRVIAPSLRGRGESGYAKDATSYVPLTYLQDIEALLDELALERFVVFGTSLGGLLAMLLAATGAERIAGALINDIGPDIEASGLARIRTYVGRAQSWPTWVHAARALRDTHHASHPDWMLEDWLAMAKRTCRLTPAGRVVPDYDLKIAEPMRLPADAIDLWPAFDALRGRPLLLVRGATSDILSEATLARMRAHEPAAMVVEVPRTGHAPTLEESIVAAAIDRLLERVAAEISAAA